MIIPSRVLLVAVPLLACLLAAMPMPDDPGSGCGIRFRDTQPIALACPKATRTIDGGGQNGAVPLAGFRGPLRVTNAYRVIETSNTASASNAVVDGLLSEDVGREGIRLSKGGNFSHLVFRNLRLVHAPLANVPPHLPEGISLESGHDIVIENSTVRGFQMIQPPRAYWNGDGIAATRGVSGVTIRNVAVLDNTDGGLDLKSTNNLLDNVYAAGNKINVRLWAGARATTLAIGPVLRRGGFFSTAGIWIKGGEPRPTVSIDTLIVDMGSKGAPAGVIVIADGPADVRIGRCIIRGMPDGTPFVKAAKGSRVVLGSGCPAAR